MSKTSVRLGGTLTFSGTVAPSHEDISSTSGYSFSIKPTARGTYYYRVYKPADTDHAAGLRPRRSFKVT